MDFQKKDWHFRDLITEGELNRMENGIEEGIMKAEQAQETAESHASRHAADGDDPLTPEMIGATSNSDYVRQPGYAVATGSENTYSVTLSPAPSSYVEGMAVAVKINVDNTDASTLNVNGLGPKPIKKANGNDVSAGNLKAGGIYTFRYDGTNFILQGEGGGGGNAQPSDVLSGKTFTNDDGEQVGTMPNHGNVTATLTNQGQEYTIPAGYHAGAGKVTANITNLTAGNVRYGATVGGVAGTFSQFANGATAAQILTGRSAAVNGAVVNGTMPNRAGDTAALSSQVVGTTLKLLASAGYRDGVDDYVTITDPDFIPANIRNGVNIFGITGTFRGDATPIATGTVTNGQTQGEFYLDRTITTPAYYPFVQISGLSLPRAPRILLLRFVGAQTTAFPIMTIYHAEGFSNFVEPGRGKIIIWAQTSENNASGSGWIFRVDGTSAYVTTTGFKLPVAVTGGFNRTFEWEIY